MADATAIAPQNAVSIPQSAGPGRVREKLAQPLGFLKNWTLLDMGSYGKFSAADAINQAVKSLFILLAHGSFHTAFEHGDPSLKSFAWPEQQEATKLVVTKWSGTIANDVIFPQLNQKKTTALGWAFDRMTERVIPCAIYCAMFAAGPAGVPGAIGAFLVTSVMADAMQEVYKELIAKPLGLK